MSPRISASGSASVRGGVDVPHARTVTRRIPPILRADACQHDVRLSGYPNRYTMMKSALGGDELLGGYPTFRDLPRAGHGLLAYPAVSPSLEELSAVWQS